MVAKVLTSVTRFVTTPLNGALFQTRLTTTKSTTKLSIKLVMALTYPFIVSIEFMVSPFLVNFLSLYKFKLLTTYTLKLNFM